MIKHLRIDNRLIHGQVAVTWMRRINADAIAVVNDAVAKDPIQKMALPLAARDAKVLVLSVDDLIKYDTEHPDQTLFVIAKFPADALRILESGLKVDEVNVGNAAPVAGTDYVMVEKRSIAATKEDAVIYRKIAELRGGKLTTQTVSTYEPQDFLELLTRAGL
ncbi:MAG: PTS sugar transporter subunit IIB [Oscillospiraceae bacterium]|nr:PTS sugar transporter subunit IIB [Oscillospiraceae bacterium]